MELRHIIGNTYVAEGKTALIPVYKVTDTDVVLLDTGYAKLDRGSLVSLIEDNHFNLRGIICTHAHFDHTGNVRYLQNKYGCLAAAQIIEAGISVNPDAYRANYVALTYGKSREFFLEECFIADVIIRPDADHLDFCGARFGILQLPGHSAGHIGIVTPDNVAYLGDCLISQSEIDHAKLPTTMFIARDLQSKKSLHALTCRAYVIAHKEVLTDIHALVDRNIAFLLQKKQEVLDCLCDGMTFSDWFCAFCKQEDIHTRNELKLSIVERNFDNFVDYLTDNREIAIQREFCAKKYFHVS